MSPRRRNRQWMVLAFVALLAAPPWATAVVVMAAILATAFRLGRLTARRSARRLGAVRGDAAGLGIDQRGRAVVLTDRELSAHGLILGASGAGKSTTLLRILTEQIARGRPVVALDLKGSPAFAQVLADAAAAAGRPFVRWSIDGPAHWNPLQHGNPTELKDKLITTERFTEPHYMRAAERHIQIVLKVLAQAHPRQAPTLPEVVKLMDPHRLPSMLRAADRELREDVQDYLARMAPDQVSAARGLQTRLAVLTESHTAPYLVPAAEGSPGRTIDLREALRGPEVVLFSLNSSRYGHLAAQLGTLVVQDLVSVSGERLDPLPGGAALPQACIGVDEFSAIGADHVVALLSRGRESGMPVFVATQEMVDLERVARGLRDQVLGVTALKIVHRQEVYESALTVAQMTGTERVWEETRQTASRLLFGYDTGRGTRRLIERFIVDPNEIMNLPSGRAVVISKLRGGRARTVRIEPPRRPEPPGLGR
jgi:conjugal transfer pilus assembly protein TraD